MQHSPAGEPSVEARMRTRVHREENWRSRLEDLWGPAPPYERQPEDDAGYLYGSLYYTWATDVMSKASKEELTAEGMPHPTQLHRAYDAGHAVSLALQDQWCTRHQWDECVGLAVSTTGMQKTRPGMRGILRYVGEVQQYRSPGTLYAGVEWVGLDADQARAAQLSSVKDESQPGAILQDGEVLDEHLFDLATPDEDSEDSNTATGSTRTHRQATQRFATFEKVKDVVFLDAPMMSAAEAKKKKDAASAVTPAEQDLSTIPPPPSSISILGALIKALGWQVLYLLPFRALADACTLISPVLLQRYISYLEGDDPSWNGGLMLVLAYLVILLVKTCVNNKFNHMNQRLSITFKNALTSVLFEKCFTISPKALSHPDFNAGRLVNMMGSDVERVQRFVSFFWTMISAPVQLCVAIYLLYNMVGLSALVGVVVMVLMLPFHGITMGINMRLFQARARATDARMRATNEFLSGIRVAKFMAWEPSFVVNIEDKRRQEVNIIKRSQLVFLAVIFVLNATPSIVIAGVFLSYILAGNTLTPSVVFPTMSLLMILQMPFVMIPMAVQSLMQVLVSVRRIAAFVGSDDVPDDSTRRLPEKRGGNVGSGGNDATALTEDEESAIKSWAVESAAAQWNRAATTSASPISALFYNATITAFTPQQLPDTPEEYLKKMKREEATRKAAVKANQSGDSKDNKKSGGGVGEAVYYALQPKALLSDLTLMIPKGGLTMILGPTGSGKSTLLDALVGAIQVTQGDVRATDSIAYVPQRAWIMNATLKDNILFYSDFDHVKFRRALKSSQLMDDIDNINGGIDAEIGERGINVSGGQKARVSLARAIYADKELYLLDDPLSALDAHVGERVMTECILGALADRTRILATHQVQWAHHADYVVVLNSDGTVRFQGDKARYAMFAAMEEELPEDSLPPNATLTDPSSTAGGPLTMEGSLAIPFSPEAVERANAFIKSISSGSFPTERMSDEATLRKQASLAGSVEILLGDMPGNVARKKTLKQRSTTDQSESVELEKGENAEETPGGKLMTIEEKAVGAVPKEIYLRFIDACGGMKLVILLVLAFVGTECLSVGPQLWLTAWSTDAFHYSPMHYLLVYLLLTSLNTLCAPARQYFLQTLMRHAGRELHSALLRSVTCGTMAFFDTTPLGRIVNRFAKDMDQVDSNLSSDYSSLLNSFFSVISSVAVMVSTQYFVVLVLLPCCYIYSRLMAFFNTANREIQRLANISNSPIFQILSETMGGRWTITAYHEATHVMQETVKRLDTVFACAYMKAIGNRWLSVRIETMTSCIVSSVAFIGVLAVHVDFMSTNIGLVSLSMTMANNISNMLNQVIMQVAAVEADMNCVERVFFYVDHIEHEDMAADLNQEVERLTALETPSSSAQEEQKRGSRSATAVVITNPDDELTEAQLREPPRDAAGRELPAIEFVHASLRYRDGLPLVLKDVNFTIRARQRVGIVGRTGSGKSTMLLAFLRLVDLADGEMRIRGAPAKQYTLRRLRQLFSMIPQDPVLFEGTARTNLDPFLESTDEEIWRALEHVGMADRVRYGAGANSGVGAGPSATPTSRAPPAGGANSNATGLDSHVQEGGMNYSVGQRQLLCMARALLRHRSCFLLMDEATANVDPALDRQIQDTVHNVFKEYTVVTIAHRLVTVASYDLIIFMENGSAVECASPRELLEQQPTTRFATLVHAMDPIAVEQFMRAMKPADDGLSD